MKKLVWLVFGLALAGFGAEVPPAPVTDLTGIINGRLTVGVKYAGIADCSLELQLKDAGEPEESFRTVATKKVTDLNEFNQNNHGVRYFSIATNIVGTVEGRVRCLREDLAGEWTPFEATGYVNQAGTGAGPAGDAVRFAMDGNAYSMVDNSDDPWVGCDFGKTIRVKAIRFYSRPDTVCRGRITGAMVQYDTDPAYTGAVTVKTLNAGEMDFTKIQMIEFETPVEARCVRITSARGGRSSVCELEVVPADAPWAPAVTMEMEPDAATGQQVPKLTWTTPAELGADTVTLERGTTAAGPFMTLAEGLPANGGGGYVDSSARLAVMRYYRVKAVCGHSQFAGQETASGAVGGARMRRLDRKDGDETKLADGVALCTSTNGTSMAGLDGFRGAERAFDGNPDTWPDHGIFNGNPLGVKFAEKMYVMRVGYTCRSDDPYPYERIKNAALFAAAADDAKYANRVQCTGNFSEACMDKTKVHWVETETLPEGGAEQWFLWPTKFSHGGTWYGNVAEVMFYGWSGQDAVESGALIGPGGLRAERLASGGGVALRWGAAINADGCRVERRGAGESGWTVVGEGLGAAATEWVDGGVTPGRWEYRVVAVKAGEGGIVEEAATGVAAIQHYASGGGTGLSGAVYAPYKASVVEQCWPTERWELPTGAVNLELGAGVEPVAGMGTAENMRFVWRGKLVAPATGSYGITLETSDGGAVHIDGKPVCNSWTGGTKAPTGLAELEAGEHDIEVDARLEGKGMPVKCVLKWSGPVPEEVVPVSQLKPLAGGEAAGLEIDGWRVRNFNGREVGRVARGANGKWVLTAHRDGPDGTDARNKLNATFAGRPWRHSFEISARVKNPLNGDAALMARARNGNMVATCFRCGNSGDSYYGMRAITNGTDKLVWLGEGAMNTGNQNHVKTWELRLRYDFSRRTFTGWQREDSSKAWAKVGEYALGEDLRGEYEFGFGALGPTGNKMVEVEVENLVWKVRKEGMMVTIK